MENTSPVYGCQTSNEYYAEYLDAYEAWAKGEREYPCEYHVTEEMKWNYIDSNRRPRITLDMIELDLTPPTE